jgi:4-hydroxy-tetrahydrodipicolinate reductase
VIRVALAGHRGRVGSELAPALGAAEDVEYLGGVEKGADLHAFLREKRPTVLVDFTQPEAGWSNAMAAAEAGVAPVVGTTGLTPEQVDEIEAACHRRSIGGVVAANFAVGAVLMMHLAEKARPFFAAVEIIELHHATKRDAPSGTALATGRRLGGEVPIHSVRLPGLVADQEVIFGLPGQTLTITHRTTGREAFAPGVLLAIRSVIQGPRFYRALDELLGLR